ncbi:lysine-specific demethylase JMJ25 isoform X1 [Herrania umbratica]|uniref:Lysine-specific demethylase JMJ25 isoform X1 n=1 Tax=Herrania umbratica TaxID=108875 RepID=A0A6J1A658_9ROSI|nr:lysine-specific demethylase JMJ25 isoform X1 [Herrania umbratica]
MDHPRSGPGHGEDNVGIPDDLRCKRSDGKQWRCTAMSMPDKTVCEKHYIQAKRRAANSALRASLKKKRKLGGESEVYADKSDDFDVPLISRKVEDYPPPVSGKKYKEKVSKNQIQYSPETPAMRNFPARNSVKMEDDYQRDGSPFEENWRSYKIQSFSAADSSRNRSQRSYDDVTMTVDDSEESSEEVFVGKTCHQCRQNDRERVSWCLKCDKRGYCDGCISTWYSNIPLEEIEKACPACRGSCNCKACLRGDNMIKVRIREIPVLDKLQYHYGLLSSVLPVVKKIHQEQCSEVELEKRLHGTAIDLVRAKVNADEQMCCNFCRIPIIDYHRHCANCSYDLCLRCCQDLRRASSGGVEDVGNETGERTLDKETAMGEVSELKLNFLDKFSGWKANSDDGIPCPPMEYGGCGHYSLNLNRIFKMNWVAKLVKNVEEMVSGCKVYDVESSEKTESNDPTLCQFADREPSDDNLLYFPSSQDLKAEGIADFRKRWGNGEPVIVKEVCDVSSMSSWDPVSIRRGIQENVDEKIKDESRMVKAVDCLDWSEVDIELGQFIKGYTEGSYNENGWLEMLKLKDWPSPGASEEFLMYQRPEFISKLPLLEYIHSRLGLLNVAAKLPHYSLQNDVGPKIYISYGTYEELGRGDSVTNLHFKMRDMVYLLVHTCDVNAKGQKTKMEDMQNSNGESEVNESLGDPETRSDEKGLPDLSLDGTDMNDEYESTSAVHEDEKMDDQGAETTVVGEKSVDFEQLNGDRRDVLGKTHAGACWDVFRRQDVPKLIEYLHMHWMDSGKPESVISDSVICPLYDEVVYLNEHHKRKLREEFDVVPWSFEQQLGQAVFVPAGCPFQVRNLQSTVQLGLDFLFPESVGEAVRLAEEIRCLPNDHDGKLQILEVRLIVQEVVGKISLYAASSAIKEVQKLVLDPKLGAELGFEDPNLTAAVSENLEKVAKRRQITCA